MKKYLVLKQFSWKTRGGGGGNGISGLEMSQPICEQLHVCVFVFLQSAVGLSVSPELLFHHVLRSGLLVF